MHTVKTRFAPSPTGLIHLGNARTALFSALLAYHHKGIFLLRIEDTDLERSKEEYTVALQQDLCWMQCRWNEGPDIGGEYGPYWQSEREAIYTRYYKKLVELGRAYDCFCTEEQLAISRKVQRIAGQAPRYAGTCRHLSDSEHEQKLAIGLKPVLRFRVDDDAIIEFDDLVKGKQKFLASDIGDFIIRRADGAPTFMFCNAIDDAFMHVTHVLRGEDHLTNTPRQLMILQALSLDAPLYGHISLILGSDGAPLSKRTGSKSIRELRELGYLPDAIINYLARLGHYYVDNHFMTFAQLAEKFSLENLSKSPARFDQQQLEYWQKKAIEHLSDEQLWNWMCDTNAGSSLEMTVPIEKRQDFIDIMRSELHSNYAPAAWAIKLFQKPLIPESHFYNFNRLIFEYALNAFEADNSDFKHIINYVKEKTNASGKELFTPLRVALTGDTQGPQIDKIAKLMGSDFVKERLEFALKHAGKN